jgi:hypothetical protein
VTVQFEIGKTYAERFASDWDSIAYFTIEARTDKTVTTKVHGKTVRRGIKVRNDVETFKPFGSYSMAMVVGADDTADKIKAEG